MEIKKLTDESFKKYGKVIEGIDFSDILCAMENTPKPLDSVVYEPAIESLELCESAKLFSSNVYGGMPIQVGFCNGNNHFLNAVEYHRDSEINIAVTDAILILGKEEDIAEDFTLTQPLWKHSSFPPARLLRFMQHLFTMRLAALKRMASGWLSFFQRALMWACLK